MLALLFVALSGALIVFANLAIKESINLAGEDRLLSLRLFVGGLALLLTGGVVPFFRHFNLFMALCGVGAGILQGIFLQQTGQAMRRGPAGLTFALLNSAAVMPPIIFATLLGRDYGFALSFPNLVGLLCIMAGFLLASSGGGGERSPAWPYSVAFCMGLQALFLLVFQWHVLLTDSSLPEHALLPVRATPESALCFAPVMFFAASLVQRLPGFRPAKRREMSLRSKLLFGVTAGICSGMAARCLYLAISISSEGWERVLVMPLFSVLILIYTGVWARVRFKERLRILSYACMVGGILLNLL